MIDYVLAVAFTKSGLLVALRKNAKLKNLEGKLNGPGGKVDTHNRELPAEAMSREFYEETGVDIHPVDWQSLGVVYAKNGTYRIYMYTYTSEEFLRVSTQTDEEVFLLNDWQASAKEMDGLFLAFTAMVSQNMVPTLKEFKV